MLIVEFKKCADWTKEQVTKLSESSGLSESQVYKWAWDQKKKLQSSSNYKIGGMSSVASDDAMPAPAQQQTKNDDDGSTLGQAEVTRDEFGGYCCKRWGTGGETSANPTQAKLPAAGEASTIEEQDICKLLGLDIDKAALEIVKQDFKKKRIPWKNASKFINVTTSSGLSLINSNTPLKASTASQLASVSNLLSTPTLKFERNTTPERKASTSRNQNDKSEFPTTALNSTMKDDQSGIQPENGAGHSQDDQIKIRLTPFN